MSKSAALLTNPRAIFEAPGDDMAPATPPPHLPPPAEHAALEKPQPHPNDVDDVKLDSEGIDTGHEAEKPGAGVEQHLAPLKALAKKSLPLIQHLVALKQCYAEDPQLNSKNAKIEMAAIMAQIFRENEPAVYFFGQVLFEPNIGSFIALFDDIGSKKLGPYLGITDVNQIPDHGGAEVATGLGDAGNEPAPPGPVPAPTAPQPTSGTPMGAGAPRLPKM